MLLNSDQVADFVRESPFSERAQVGIDLSIKNITKIVGGVLGNRSKKVYNYLSLDKVEIEGKSYWNLGPGVYSLTFNEGVKLPEDKAGFVKHKSTVLRIGGQITSGVFDPGFECENLGATLFVKTTSILIEENAQAAQFLIWESNKTTKAYNGSYQGDKDLK